MVHEKIMKTGPHNQIIQHVDTYTKCVSEMQWKRVERWNSYVSNQLILTLFLFCLQLIQMCNSHVHIWFITCYSYFVCMVVHVFAHVLYVFHIFLNAFSNHVFFFRMFSFWNHIWSYCNIYIYTHISHTNMKSIWKSQS